jgi:hypothetical protein
MRQVFFKFLVPKKFFGEAKIGYQSFINRFLDKFLNHNWVFLLREPKIIEKKDTDKTPFISNKRTLHRGIQINHQSKKRNIILLYLESLKRSQPKFH